MDPSPYGHGHLQNNRFCNWKGCFYEGITVAAVNIIVHNLALLALWSTCTILFIWWRCRNKMRHVMIVWMTDMLALHESKARKLAIAGAPIRRRRNGCQWSTEDA